MTLEINDNQHDCEKPDMVLEVIQHTEWVFWPLFKKAYTETIYEERDARFTCDVCGTVWSWWNPFWMCVSRPDKWKVV